jgi:hypothetical protein
MDPAKWEAVKEKVKKMVDSVSLDDTGMSVNWEDADNLYWANFQMGLAGKDSFQVNFGMSAKSKVQPLTTVAVARGSNNG